MTEFNIDTFPQNIMRAMTIYDMDQNDLARKSGMARSTIGMYVSGRREPQSTAVCKLAKALGCDPNFLLGWEIGMKEIIENSIKFKRIKEITN